MKHCGLSYGGAIELQSFNAVSVAHQLTVLKLATARNIVDATAGNGRDTLFLAQNSGAQAMITAFDIQKTALNKTRQLLTEHRLMEKVRLIADSHANVARHVTEAVDIAVFNLGYLPGGSHEISTNADSTLAAVQQLIALLGAGGLISLIAYPGYPAGHAEHSVLQQYFLQLQPKIFTVSCWQMINHTGKAPVFYLIEKVRS